MAWYSLLNNVIFIYLFYILAESDISSRNKRLSSFDEVSVSYSVLFLPKIKIKFSNDAIIWTL